MKNTKLFLIKPENVLFEDFLVKGIDEKEKQKIPNKGVVSFIEGESLILTREMLSFLMKTILKG